MRDFILLIPYFNNPKGLAKSIKSIDYPIDKFEVLVIDDGSKIPLSENELKSQFLGLNIRVITMSANSGIAKALNKGLEELHKRNDYKYIARLDCGDICATDRFIKQVKHLDSSPQIYLLGSWCKFTNSETGRSYLYKTKTTQTGIIKEMHFKCSFIHPTVMFRKEVLDTIGYYPENYPHAEDYAYFWKIIKHYQCALLPEALVNIETNRTNISTANYKKQLISRGSVVNDFGSSLLLKAFGKLFIQLKLITPIWLIKTLKFSF